MATFLIVSTLLLVLFMTYSSATHASGHAQAHAAGAHGGHAAGVHGASKRAHAHQFPEGDENLKLPPILIFTLHMGPINILHLPLLLESMKWNPDVEFVVVNIIEDENAVEVTGVKAQIAKAALPNFRLEFISGNSFRELVVDKLGIRIALTKEWQTKVLDFKPTLAHLFPHLLSQRPYKYWGYSDIDLIWGNFSRFSGWFQGNIPFVVSGHNHSTGAANFFINEPWTHTLFQGDSRFLRSLEVPTYFNLDGDGSHAEDKKTFESDKGPLSISAIQQAHLLQHNLKTNHGKTVHDHCYIDQEDAFAWAGAVRWWQGSLQIIHASHEFPPGRELLFFLHPEKNLDFPAELREEMFEDMSTYGYLLPSWVPIMTRYMCRAASSQGTSDAMANYRPYDKTCFRKGGMHAHSID